MRILVTGASGFVGAQFCLAAGSKHSVVGVHFRTDLKLPSVESLRCDLGSASSSKTLAAAGADAVVHLACKVKSSSKESPDELAEKNRRMLDAVLNLQLPLVYASSTVVHWPRPTAYGRSRLAEEKRVQAAGIPWAVVRPCAPYGPRLTSHRPRHKESFHTLADLVRRLPVIPVPGSGRGRRQPVHVEDFSHAILALLEKGLPGRGYDAGGGTAHTMNQVVDLLATAVGKRVRKVHVPPRLLTLPARFSRDFEPELLAAFDSDDTADPGPLAEATGVTPRGFAAGAPCLFL